VRMVRRPFRLPMRDPASHVGCDGPERREPEAVVRPAQQMRRRWSGAARAHR